MQAALPKNERERLAALRTLNLLDTTRTIEFDVFPELASQIFDVPMSAISLIDADRQWFKASVGLQVAETPRAVSLCAHVIENPDEVLCVPDPTTDPRFADNPLVCGEFGLRFYAGAPIVDPTGHVIGALCVMDRKPRKVDADRLHQLRILATAVGNVIKRHADEQTFRRREGEQAAVQAMLAAVFQKTDAAVAVMRSNVLLANPAYARRLGYRVDELARLPVKQLAAPEFREAIETADRHQLATGAPYEIDAVLVRKDGERVAVNLKSVLVRRADAVPFQVITLQPPGEAAGPVRKSMQTVAGSIMLLGLEPIKAAFGSRWEEVRSRMMQRAEGILKQRLRDSDIYVRTPDDGFSVWFKEGSEDENAARIARVGREMRIMLLGEFGEDTKCSVGTYTQVAEVADPEAPAGSIMEALTKRLADRRRKAEQDARELLDEVIRDQPRESTPIYTSSAQATDWSFIDLPRAIQGRFAGAMSLVGGHDGEINAELMRLGLAAEAILEDSAPRKSGVHVVVLSAALLLQRSAREQFIKQWRTFGPTVGPRLFVMLSGAAPDTSPARLAEAARTLKSMTKGVGIMLDQIETLPFDLQSCPFSVLGLTPEAVAGLPDAKLRAFIVRAHQAKARVLVQLAEGESAQRWSSLGADLTSA